MGGWSKYVQHRAEIWIEAQGECWLCHRFVPYLTATIDHVFPVSVGGSRLSKDNMRLAHGLCNNKRHQNKGMSREEHNYWAQEAHRRGWRSKQPRKGED